ncbi:MAG TPA: nitroreductase family protein [Armatimonadota bacterium]|nr:nitroreductase family protein [Armatimonadota bacterium]
MDTIEVILNRRSVRRYLDSPIATGDLATMVECARQAPSAGNRQSCHLVVVTDPPLRERVAAACQHQEWMAGAAAIVVGLGDPSVSERWCEVDTAIAMENLVLAATSLGYGACWVGAFDEERLREVLGVPETMRVVAAATVGRAAEKPQARPRRDIGDFASLQRYGAGFAPE